MLEYVFRTADIFVQSVYIGSLVHMYRNYLYMFICTRCTTFRSYLSYAKTCSYRVKGGGSYISPHFTPPLVFPGEKIYTSYHMNFAFMVKCLSFGALLLWQFFFYFATQLKVLALRWGLQGYFPKKTFSSMCREKNGRPSAKSLFIHYISQNSDSWSFEGQILLNLKNQGMVSSVTFSKNDLK